MGPSSYTHTYTHIIAKIDVMADRNRQQIWKEEKEEAKRGDNGMSEWKGKMHKCHRSSRKEMEEEFENDKIGGGGKGKEEEEGRNTMGGGRKTVWQLMVIMAAKYVCGWMVHCLFVCLC